MTITPHDKHLLHPEDATEFVADERAIWYRAQWFPFFASVSKPVSTTPGLVFRWRWQIRLIGAGASFSEGESDDLTAAFERVAEARREALLKLHVQFPHGQYPYP